MKKPFVTPKWLEQNIGQVQVLDATWFMPNVARNARDEFKACHIPTAKFFDIDRFSHDDSGLSLPHMLPSTSLFSQQLSSFGLDHTKTIVVYDNQGLFSSPRAWFTLRLLGLDVYILQGGMKAWQNVYPTESGLTECKPVPDFTPENSLVDSNVLTWKDIRDNIDSGQYIVVDVRSSERFRAKVPEPRPECLGGHIPKSVNIPFTDLIRDQTDLKSPAELTDIFQEQNIDISDSGRIVFTCGSGLTACIGALAVHTCGKPLQDIYLYDGSWTEWGNPSMSSPIEQ